MEPDTWRQQQQQRRQRQQRLQDVLTNEAGGRQEHLSNSTGPQAGRDAHVILT
jgi:hypothetical protein